MIIKIIILGVLLYLAWALVHHKKDKSLTLAILLEYLLTALLVVVVLTGVIF